MAPDPNMALYLATLSATRGIHIAMAINGTIGACFLTIVVCLLYGSFNIKIPFIRYLGYIFSCVLTSGGIARLTRIPAYELALHHWIPAPAALDIISTADAISAIVAVSATVAVLWISRHLTRYGGRITGGEIVLRRGK